MPQLSSDQQMAILEAEAADAAAEEQAAGGDETAEGETDGAAPAGFKLVDYEEEEEDEGDGGDAARQKLRRKLDGLGETVSPPAVD